MINRASIEQEAGDAVNYHKPRQDFDLSRQAVDVVFSTVRLMTILKIWCRLKNRIFNSYRPELHYMRGPGPKWREKHAHAGSGQWPGQVERPVAA